MTTYKNGQIQPKRTAFPKFARDFDPDAVGFGQFLANASFKPGTWPRH